MTEKEVRALLAAECAKAGSQKAWADKHKMSAAYVSDVVNGRRDLADAICKALGLQRVMMFKRKSRKSVRPRDLPHDE